MQLGDRTPVGNDRYGWGPERENITMKEPASYVTFNSIIDNPALGNERNFVRVTKKGSGASFTGEVFVMPGDEIAVYIWIHNNASKSLNDSGKGVSLNTRLRCAYSKSIGLNQYGGVRVGISSDNANPQRVWDGAIIYSDVPIKLEYVQDSAIISNGGKLNGTVFHTEKFFFNNAGQLWGYDELDGVLKGCDQYSGNIVFTLKVSAL